MFSGGSTLRFAARTPPDTRASAGGAVLGWVISGGSSLRDSM